jgi:hypothetical protein
MQILKIKTHVQFIQLHMTRLQIFFKQRMKKHKHDVLIKVFIDKINIVYSKCENVVVEKQKKRRLREKSNERKRCTLSCLQTKEKTSFFRTKFSLSSFWENEETCEAHIKRKIDAEFARRWWRIFCQKKWNCIKIWSNRKTLSLFIWKRNV